MKYRAEIDGLRAIAVIPVIFFHAGYTTFSGGFVGVDIFFVISGYLITTIILAEMEKGNFSIVNFYERRARRILPALFLVMLVSLPFAWLWLMPSDMMDYSKSLMAVSTFSSNILFWLQTGYWGASNNLKPLLHTWSLAVEEQYYVLFPLFLMLMWRFRKRWILSSFMIVAIVSLLLSQWAAYHKPTADFFILPTRGWELAIGAAIAFYFLYRKNTIRTLLFNKSIDEAMGLLGLLMIGYSIFAFDETVPFPSFYTLVPTIGTGLIILFSSSNTLIGKFLGARYLVGIGLISYSAYLWHQPLFAFARHRSLTVPSEFVFAGLAALSIFLAYLSWKYVETPFRNRKAISRKSIFSFAFIGSVAFIAIGATGYKSHGFETRTTKSGFTIKELDEKLIHNDGLGKHCSDVFSLPKECMTSDKPDILVWGDSYARQLVDGILASNPTAKIVQLTKNVCGPFFDVAPIVKPKYPVSWSRSCLDFTQKVREWLKRNKSVKFVVLSSPFSDYVSKDFSILLRNGTVEQSNLATAVKEFRNTLEEIKALGITPIIFSPLPSTGNDIGRCLARAELRGINLDDCNFQTSDITHFLNDAYKFLDNFKDDYRVIPLNNFICSGKSCITHLGSSFIYRDNGHMSREGSAALGKKYDFYGLITNHTHGNTFQ